MVRAPQNLLQMKHLRYTTDIFKGQLRDPIDDQMADRIQK